MTVVSEAKSRNIFHFITSLEGGGAQRALATLLSSLGTRGHVIYYIHGGPYVQKLCDAGYRVQRVRGLLHPYDPFLCIRLFLLLYRERPMVLHTSLVVANVLGRIMGWLLRIPVVSDVHSDVRFHGRLRNWCERLTARFPARYIAVSQTVRDAFLDEMCGVVSVDKVTVIYNGVDVDDIWRQSQPAVTRKSLGIPSQARVIGAVGRLEKIKRYDVLIEAHALLCQEAYATGRPLPHLVIVGSGSQEELLKEMVAQMSSRFVRSPGRNVHFLGWKDNVYPYYPLFDCTVFSSDSEGISYALLESLACGTPVVTTHTEKEHEVIKTRQQGVVVRPDCATALAVGVRMFLVHKKQKVSLISSKFSQVVMAKEYERMYETLR